MAEIREKLTELKISRKRLGIVARYRGFESPDDFLDKIAEVLSAGAGIIELTDDNMPDGLFLETGKKVKQLCEMFNATYIVRNRCDIAYLTSADGVNLEQGGLDIRSAREIVGKELIIGNYVNSPKDLIQSVKDGADYISVGSISSTPTEPVTSTGLEYAKWVSENTLLPVLVCGEFSTEQCRQLKTAGAERFLIDGTILNSVSPNTVTVNYINL